MGSERTPLWKVTVVSEDSVEAPLFLPLRIAGSSLNCQKRDVGLYFEDATARARAFAYFQESKRRQLQRLHAQLAAFIDRVQQECWEGQNERSLTCLRSVHV